ncbi:MAG TPA: GAF domain-containing protein, partial [Candidatus Limnocylindrales bacterium]|nr:GAF domain-containing protein [Candidatus Limnocylindrales bacterium]
MAVAFDRDSESTLMTVADVAAVAGVHRSLVLAWCTSGALASVPGRRRGERRIRPADLDAFLAASGAAQETRVSASAAGPAEATEPTESDGRGARPQLLRWRRDDGTDALRRIAAEVSGPLDLPTLFDEVIEDSMALFSVRRVGLWLVDQSSERPLTLAAQRGVPDEVVEWVSTLAIDDEAVGLAAIRSRRVVAIPDALAATTMATQREVYSRHQIGSVCFAPIVFRDEPLGLLVLYHETVRSWTADETELARTFADQMAVAIGNARLYDSVQALAARLRAIHDLALRLNRIRDLDEIAAVIVEGTERLIRHDTIRVYRLDHEHGVLEAIAFEGSFPGHPAPSLDELRLRVGEGLTGWAAAHNETLIIGDAARDPRSVLVYGTPAPESMLVVPMTFEDRVQGVIVVSVAGTDRYG